MSDEYIFPPEEKQQIIEAADQIGDILEELPGPRHAANAIAKAHARLCLMSGGTTEEQVRFMLQEMTEGIVGNWRGYKDKLQ